jgi:hypothetical protein
MPLNAYYNFRERRTQTDALTLQLDIHSRVCEQLVNSLTVSIWGYRPAYGCRTLGFFKGAGFPPIDRKTRSLHGNLEGGGTRNLQSVIANRFVLTLESRLVSLHVGSQGLSRTKLVAVAVRADS